MHVVVSIHKSFTKLLQDDREFNLLQSRAKIIKYVCLEPNAICDNGYSYHTNYAYYK